MIQINDCDDDDYNWRSDFFRKKSHGYLNNSAKDRPNKFNAFMAL